jgi:hypothetical protein
MRLPTNRTFSSASHDRRPHEAGRRRCVSPLLRHLVGRDAGGDGLHDQDKPPGVVPLASTLFQSGRRVSLQWALPAPFSWNVCGLGRLRFWSDCLTGCFVGHGRRVAESGCKPHRIVPSFDEA